MLHHDFGESLDIISFIAKRAKPENTYPISCLVDYYISNIAKSYHHYRKRSEITSERKQKICEAENIDKSASGIWPFTTFQARSGGHYVARVGDTAIGSPE